MLKQIYLMNTLSTCGVTVSVNPEFESGLSSFLDQVFFFKYTVLIENNSNNIIQLVSRRWEVYDTLDYKKIIEGAGVVGEQPILKPGEKYTYTSGCELKSEIGLMKGLYKFKNVNTYQNFEVLIPEFNLISDGKLN